MEIMIADMKQELNGMKNTIATTNKPKKKKKTTKYKRSKRAVLENTAPPVVLSTTTPNHVDNTTRTMVLRTNRRPDTPMPVMSVQTPTAMVGHSHSVIDNGFGIMSRYGHPNFPNTGGQQYISPVFAARNMTPR